VIVGVSYSALGFLKLAPTQILMLFLNVAILETQLEHQRLEGKRGS
jgi:hypothetical protein